MGQYLAADNAATLLAASVTNSPSVTSLILQDASKFPVVNHGGTGSDWSYVTLYDSANNIETVKLTRRDSGSNTLTIVRGTAAGISGITDVSCLAWAATTTGVACRLVSQVVNDITAQAGTAASSASSAAASAASAASTATNAQTTATNAQTSLSNIISGVAGFVKAKLGQAANTAYNFLFDASAADGTLKLVRESGQDILTVDANGNVLVGGNNLNLFSAKSLADNGYQKLPSGLIIQWGGGSTAVGGSNHAFPIAFPNACFGVTATNSPQNVNNTTVAYNITTTQFSAASYPYNSAMSMASNLRYIAIGY